MQQGTIKKLIAEKGFGFIKGDNGEIFFHHSSLIGTTIEALQEGQAVEFEEGRGPKGPRAVNVRPAYARCELPPTGPVRLARQGANVQSFLNSVPKKE